MDKSLKYEQAILNLFEEYATFWRTNTGVENHIIADKERHRYQLILVGWQDGKRYVHSVAFHIEIIDGRIWIHQNNTEALIADELIAKGVQKSDIILGFIPPNERIYTGFASA